VDEGRRHRRSGTLGGSSSIALNVNTPGQIVGQAALTGNTTTHAFLYEGGVMKDLNTLVVNKPAGLELLAAARVNDSGSMIAYTNTGVVPAVADGARNGTARGGTHLRERSDSHRRAGLGQRELH
jgi:probable HAF family extracellular repeat protein